MVRELIRMGYKKENDNSSWASLELIQVFQAFKKYA